MWSRRGLMAAAGAGFALGAAAPASRAAQPVFRFVSMPDFLNADVADLSVLPSWDGGRNSVNGWWERALDDCLSAVASHAPDAIFVAGDQVEGRWTVDTHDRQLFGPVPQGIDEESLRLCRHAITRAGGVYYGYYRELFSSRGLALYPALGDHEILDDRGGPLNERWPPGGMHGGRPDNRYHLVDHSKDVWADHFTRDPGGRPIHRHRPRGTAAEFTAYRRSFADVLTLITVDLFDRTPTGVRLGVFDDQLAWVASEIRKAKRRGHVVIVQGHIPVLRPYRVFASGNLHVKRAERSPFWRTLRRTGADFYFCGEVHDSTVVTRGARGPVQISHGSTYRHSFSYLVGAVQPGGRVELELFEMQQVARSQERELWASDALKWAPTRIAYGPARSVGRLSWRAGRVRAASGKLGRYDPTDDPYAQADVPAPPPG